MECGNIRLSKIVQMKIDSLGNSLFDDTELISYSETDPEWANFKQKIKSEKSINLEDSLLVKDRIKKILSKIGTMIDKTEDEKELKQLYESPTEEKNSVNLGFILFPVIIFGFFEQLKKNISNFLPCDIPQDKIAQYTFAKYINQYVNFTNPIIKGGALPLNSNRTKAESFEKLLCYFFKKNDKGLYEPSLEKANEQIKKVFKARGKKLDDLKTLVDTDKGTNLKNASITWKTVKKVLVDSNEIFKGVDELDIRQYKQSYFIYMLLRNFEKAVDTLIPQITRSKVIEDILNNMEYLKSLRDHHFGEDSTENIKIAESSMEHILYDDNQPLRATTVSDSVGYFGFGNEFNIDFFWYDRKSPDDMKPLLEYGAQVKYIDYLFAERSYHFNNAHSYGEDTFNKETELYFQEKICCEERLGKSSSFFFKWYEARIKYAEYIRERYMIEKVSQAYLEAYDIGLYFAGNYTTTFVKEAIKIFLEEYKLTKRTGRIKEIYQYATALGLTMQLYKDFKDSGFNDPTINPYEWFIRLWDSDHDIVDIAELTGLTWQMVQKILLDNKKFLKRKDKDSLKELGRYITKWECDEYGIDTDEEWD